MVHSRQWFHVAQLERITANDVSITYGKESRGSVVTETLKGNVSHVIVVVDEARSDRPGLEPLSEVGDRTRASVCSKSSDRRGLGNFLLLL